MMRRFPFFALIASAIICFFICSFLICDDDENPKEQFYNSLNLGTYSVFIQEDVFRSDIFYVVDEETTQFDSIISYLAQHEKSPPTPS